MSQSSLRVSIEDLREEIADLDSPEDRIAYLIELGQTLPELPKEYQTEEYRVLGCQSMVWLVPKLQGDKKEGGDIEFRGSSDAPMVRGLVAILLAAYSGRKARDILAFPVEDFFGEIQLKSFLTPMRSNGLHSMVQRIQAIAKGALLLDVSPSSQPQEIRPPRASGYRVPLPAIAIENCRDDFPILSEKLPCGKPWVYLDNAASSQRPTSVLDAMNRVYRTHYANVHRSGHQLAAQTTQAMEQSREVLASWIQADSSEQVIFTPGTTASINLVARSWGDVNLRPGDEILLTEMEHHSNIVPWQQLAERTGAIIRWLGVRDDFHLDIESLDRLLSGRTKLVALTAVSNVLGTINPVREIVDAAHRVGAKVLVDAAQSAPHGKATASDWDADWLVFSGHKMLGPTGIGVLYGTRELLESMPPFLGGGNMIKSVSKQGFVAADSPHRFEAGTAPIVEAIAMKPALEYLMRVGSEVILAHERRLAQRAIDGLSSLSGLRILGPSIQSKTGIVSFVIPGVHSDQIGQYLNAAGVAIRVGHHCAMPLHERFSVGVSARASFYFYNTQAEVDAFVTSTLRACEL
jgi:cysteine desulfurase/selenocysteine lyase